MRRAQMFPIDCQRFTGAGFSLFELALAVPLHAFSWRAERHGDELVRGGGFVGSERFRDCPGGLIPVSKRPFKYARTCLAESGLLVSVAARAECIGTVATLVMPAPRERKVSRCSVFF